MSNTRWINIGEERFKRIARMSSRLLDVPFVLLSILDEKANVFNNRCSIGIDTTSHAIEGSFGKAVLRNKSAVVVSDASKDERFAEHMTVTGEPHVRFFAGHPLYSQSGAALGALCIMDVAPRTMSLAQLEVLKELAAMAEFELESDEFYTIDPISKVANRRGFETLAGHSLAICQRQGIRATLLHLDLVGFTKLNHEQGIEFCNKLLEQVGGEITNIFRESDSLGRTGPDEFAVLLTNTSPEQIETVILRLDAGLRSKGRELSPDVNLEFSFATIEYNAGRHAALPMLLAEAESSLHEVPLL